MICILDYYLIVKCILQFGCVLKLILIINDSLIKAFINSFVYISIYINRIRMFVGLSVGYILLIKPNSIHMLYMERSGIYRGRFVTKN